MGCSVDKILEGYNLPRLPGRVSGWGKSFRFRLLWADAMLKDQLNALDYRLKKLPDSKHRSCVLERLRIIRRQKLIRQLRAKIDRYALQLTGAPL